MRITVSIDDVIYKAAMELADLGMQEAEIFQEALKVFTRIQAGKQLADLGDKMPLREDVSRRRSESDS